MKPIVGLFYFCLWAVGVITVKGFWIPTAAIVIPVVGPYEGVKYLAHHFGIL